MKKRPGMIELEIPMAEPVDRGPYELSARYHPEARAFAEQATHFGINLVLIWMHAANRFSVRRTNPFFVEWMTDRPQDIIHLISNLDGFECERESNCIRVGFEGGHIADIYPALSALEIRLCSAAVHEDVCFASSAEETLAHLFECSIRPSVCEPDRIEHLADLYRIAQGRDGKGQELDFELLHELGELVYVGGGDELVEYARTAQKGERIEM